VLHAKPISSQKAANTKSLCASGIYQNFCNHFQYHCPNTHHQPIAIIACLVCHPAPRHDLSDSGEKKYANLLLIYET
jgi:hypothetical protein